jgi:hypothetical protein
VRSLSASFDEALHHLWAYSALVWDVDIVGQIAEVSEAVFALCRGFLICDEHAFNLSKSRIAGIIHDYFDF